MSLMPLMSISTIKIWKKIISTGDEKQLMNIIHEKAIFHSPVVYLPQKGKEKVFKYLSSAVKTFHGKSFAYTDNIISKNEVYFAEFRGHFDNIEVNGIDLIKCEDGLIKEFKVFLRPIKGIEKVWNEMQQRLVEYDNNLSQ